MTDGRERLRVHLLGLAHVPLSEEKVPACAYTHKVIMFIRLLRHDIDIVYYGVEGSHMAGIDVINVVPYNVYEASKQRAIERGATSEGYYALPHYADIAWYSMWNRCLSAIAEHLMPNELIVASTALHKRTFRGIITPHRGFFRHTPVIELGVGYYNPFTKFRIWESYAIMHHVYGLEKNNFPNPYDAVIPNPVDFEKIKFNPSRDRKPYLLYLGRIIEGKGIIMAAEVAKYANIALIVAGPKLTNDVSPSIRRVINYDNVTYVGVVDHKKRADLLANATALIMPSLYLEPFGNAHAEALAAGTPVITMHYGVFANTVPNGLVGWRIHDVDEGIWAVEHIDEIDPAVCRRYAEQCFSPLKVRMLYLDYFDRILARTAYRKVDVNKRTERDIYIDKIDWDYVINGKATSDVLQ